MPWVITRLCIDCLDTACVSVCPVDCIYEYVGADRAHFPNQLYINPDECIDCGACEPECPWQAIYSEPAVPELFKTDVELNRQAAERRDEFRVKTFEHKAQPTAEEVAANKRKWGLNPDT
jgi:ferredoxin